MKFKERALVLAPHTDDGELGCGGTIARLTEEGTEVYCAAFSLCKTSLPANLPPDTLEKEVKIATQILGIKPENLILFDFDVRTFKQFRQEILDAILKLKSQINPDIVFVPSAQDIHQDHQVISEEGLRAFKHVSLLGYELPWNDLSFHTQCFVTLQENHINKKIEALGAYESQKHRSYLNSDFLRSMAVVRGVQNGSKFAEAFEVIRWMI